jgi:hypothetical protein
MGTKQRTLSIPVNEAANSDAGHHGQTALAVTFRTALTCASSWTGQYLDNIVVYSHLIS